MVHIVISSPFKEAFTKRSKEIVKAEGKKGNTVYPPNFVDMGKEWEDTYKTQLDLAMNGKPPGKMLQLVIGGLTDNQKMEASWARERRLEIDVQEMTLYLILAGLEESKVINVILTPNGGRGAQKALEVAAANTDDRTITYNTSTGSDALAGVMPRDEFEQIYEGLLADVMKKVKKTGGKAFVMMAGGTTMEESYLQTERDMASGFGIPIEEVAY